MRNLNPTAAEDQRIAAWNSQDVEAVLDCYTEHLLYRDPNTRGEVKGRENMRRYLRKLFASWNMHWSLREVHPLAGVEGAAALWHASFRRGRRGDGGEVVEVDGMDLVLLEGERIFRNEVYFDRALLAPLMR
jgi:ketosteroid isomerase-like protein